MYQEGTKFLIIIFIIMIHKNSPKSNLWQLISTKNNKLHNKVTRRMGEALMQVPLLLLLLLLHRLVGDTITFSMSEKIQERTTDEKRCQEQQPVCRRKELITVRSGSQTEKVIQICASYTSKNSCWFLMCEWITELWEWYKNEITENKGAENASEYQLSYITQATEKVKNIHKQPGEEAGILPSHNKIKSDTMTQKQTWPNSSFTCELQSVNTF